jgi:methylthioribulose-1-phosphate dehydratase
MRALSLPSAAVDLTRLGRRFYDRGWVMGTSGNFSVVLARSPLRLAITASSVHKGTLLPAQILKLNDQGRVHGRRTPYRPSAEAALHLEIIRKRDAGSVLHTHSVWSTLLSDLHSSSGVLRIANYEMLKGLTGVTTHEHEEVIPILENDQDMTRLSARLGATLDEYPSAKAILLKRHGLYTWGATLADAERHIEILEFLFETVGRTASVTSSSEVRHGAGTSS